MSRMITLRTTASETGCPIEIGNGLLASGRLIELLAPQQRRVAVVSDDTVGRIYAVEITEQLRFAGVQADLFCFPSGEANKTRETKATLEDQLLAAGFGRDDTIVAVGGGVVTDVAGFLAATFGRGIPFISVPTSLLAMTDAAIGGKTGVNTPAGKNLIGAILQPEAVVIDIEVLRSLPQHQLREGVAEMIKHGIIKSPNFLAYLHNNADKILALDSAVLAEAIEVSCKIKCGIVETDERERSGERRQLNFGHTIGHALEQATGYTLSHGQAVAIGMVVEARLAVKLGRLEVAAVEKIIATLKRFGFSLTMPSGVTAKSIKGAMAADKKTKAGTPRFVILKSIGSCDRCNGEYCIELKPQYLDKILGGMCHDLCVGSTKKH